MARLELFDTGMQMVMKMSEGNPGAMRVIMELMESAEKIDPDSALGALGPIMHLDTLEIYSSDIWLLYKDICGENLAMTMAVLRANQMGIISHETVKTSIKGDGCHGRDIGIGLDTLMSRVQERLPNFNQMASAE